MTHTPPLSRGLVVAHMRWLKVLFLPFQSLLCGRCGQWAELRLQDSPSFYRNLESRAGKYFDYTIADLTGK